MKEKLSKQSIILLVCVICICIICLCSVSYAFFTIQIKGNDTAKPMEVVLGSMKMRFDDSNAVKLENALPGDSIIKKFKITNIGNLPVSNYNIKLNVETNDFEDQQDLEITLSRDGMESVHNIVPASGTGYILTGQNLGLNETHEYTFTLKFKLDSVNKNQNNNKNKNLKFTIFVDTEKEASVYQSNI